MRRLFVAFAVLLSVSVYGAREPRYAGVRLFWDFSSRVRVCSGGYSRLTCLADGRLLLVTEQSGNVVGVFSSDGGSTWDKQFTIATKHDNINMCVPDLMELRDGTIIVAYNPRPESPYTEDRKFGIRCKRSTDGGATWGEEIFVDDATYDFYNGCWEPSLLALPSGEVQIYFADEEPYPSVGYGDQQISMCRSYDNGATWSAKQKVSYRAGYRDGMPVPILSADGEEIIVAIEDNGWGYGDFFPTTVRCPLSVNWADGYFVDGSSSAREPTLDFAFCPVVTGGAPYLRTLGTDATVLSWQSTYDSSVNKMWTAVGTASAHSFKALTKPFITAANEATEWNSVAVVDTVVYAVGGVAGSVNVERGYPKTQLEAARATPVLDGQATLSDGYYTPSGAQISLGGQTGTIARCDFAYDRDSLYFVCWVDDDDQIVSGNYQDGVYLCVDAADTSDTAPAEGTFKYFFRLSGRVQRYAGTGSVWRLSNTNLARYALQQTDTYYIIEAAIPWEDMGLASPPTYPLAVNIEVQNGSASSKVTETIPDAGDDAPYTWMLLHLQDLETGIQKVAAERERGDIQLFLHSKSLTITAPTMMTSVALYTLDGRCLAHDSHRSASCTLLVPLSGVVLVGVTLDNGTTITRRITIL